MAVPAKIIDAVVMPDLIRSAVLKAADASCQQILDRLRPDIASSYLDDSPVSMSYLADILGYAALSAFSRACKRRFGLAPRSWQTRA
jgi:AraC-like DNA-binding protein